MLLFIDKVPGDKVAFENKVRDISYKLGVDPAWLMFVINYETGGTFDPSIKNSIGATGLIQFLPTTAKYLGTTVEDLAKMSAVDQLDYVYKYLKIYKGQMVDFYTTYLAVFYPAALDDSDSYVFSSSVVSANPGFFKTGNTLADFKQALNAIVYSKVPTTYYDQFFKKKEGSLVSTKRNAVQIYQRELIIIAVIIILLIILWYLYKKL